jgi:hypothetical protein
MANQTLLNAPSITNGNGNTIIENPKKTVILLPEAIAFMNNSPPNKKTSANNAKGRQVLCF